MQDNMLTLVKNVVAFDNCTLMVSNREVTRKKPHLIFNLQNRCILKSKTFTRLNLKVWKKHLDFFK